MSQPSSSPVLATRSGFFLGPLDRMDADLNSLRLILGAFDRTREAYLILTPTPQCVRVLYINTAFVRMTGYTPEDLQQQLQGTSSDSATGSLGELLNFIHQNMGNDEGLCRDLYCHRKDGTPFWAELQLLPVQDKNDFTDHWIGIIRDISDRKATEQSLVESQMRLNGILNSLSDVVWSMDIAQEHFLYLSPATERVLGRKLDEFYRMPELWRLMIHPEDAPRVSEVFNRVLETGGYEVDYRVLRPDGQTVWLRNKAKVVYGSDGKPVHIDGIADDITTHKLVETRVERMANFPKFNPNPIYEFDAKAEITYFNSAAEALSKSLGEESVRAILPPDTRAIVLDCLNTGKPRLRVEVTYGKRTISWSFFPITTAGFVHCYAGDITERLQLEAQLRQSEKLKSVGQLAGGIAHDFNNILTILQGYSSLLLSRDDLNPEVRSQLEEMDAATCKAADLTKQLLMFSRRQVLQPKVFDLTSVLLNLGKMLQRLLGEDVQLTVQQRTGAQALVCADQGMLEQVIVNLASNARDAMPRGGSLRLSTHVVQITPEVASRNPDAVPGRFAVLTAQDTGVGMDRATISHIFEPFFTTKEPGKGTGLGLSTVYGIVKQHNGWIEVDSVIGKGTTFRIYLPLSQNTPDSPTTPVSDPGTIGGNETIFVVEDEAPVRLLLRSILESAGYTVVEGRNGLDALSKWEQHGKNIDLLLTDIVMPGGINGVDLAARLLLERPSLRVLYTSGYSSEVLGEKVAFSPNEDFLPKPYAPHQVLRMVRACFDKQHAVTG